MVMIKAIRIFEVPFYLLVIALGCFENEATWAQITGIILTIISAGRLLTNYITDDIIYKNN
tara:strand:+ start:407 stop:589 length:183 start_codon:yes stop_codon:yes gene_type:complete